MSAGVCWLLLHVHGAQAMRGQAGTASVSGNSSAAGCRCKTQYRSEKFTEDIK